MPPSKRHRSRDETPPKPGSPQPARPPKRKSAAGVQEAVRRANQPLNRNPYPACDLSDGEERDDERSMASDLRSPFDEADVDSEEEEEGASDGDDDPDLQEQADATPHELGAGLAAAFGAVAEGGVQEGEEEEAEAPAMAGGDEGPSGAPVPAAAAASWSKWLKPPAFEHLSTE